MVATHLTANIDTAEREGDGKEDRREGGREGGRVGGRDGKKEEGRDI